MVPEVYDQLVASLYEAAQGVTPWSAALDLLAREFDLWCVQLGAVDSRWRRLLFRYQGGPAPALATLDYFRSYHALNPGLAQCMALPVGEWLHSHEAFDESFVQQNEFFQEFLIPHGGRHFSATKVLEDDGAIVLLSAVRPVDGVPLAPAQVHELDRIKHHLIRALRSGNDLARPGVDAAAAKRLLDQFSYPMFLVDDHRSIRTRNGASDDVLGPDGFLEQRAGSLACRDPDCDVLLAQTVRQLNLAAEPAPGAPARRFAKLRNIDGRPIGLYAVAIRPDAALGMFGSVPVALLIFHDPRRQTALDPLIVAEMFDLSPAEAKVAVSLALGKAPDEIAAAGRISVSTVRAQIKSIFAKTGVSRQSELVALLRSMPGVSRLGR